LRAFRAIGRVNGLVIPVRLNDLMAAEQGWDELPGFPIRLPDGDGPAMDEGIPFGSGGSSQHIQDRQRAALLGQRDERPGFLMAGELHMRQLDLATGELLFDMQVEPDEGEGQFDRFCSLVCGLGGKGIHDELVNKVRVALGEGIKAQLVEGVLSGVHGCILTHLARLTYQRWLAIRRERSVTRDNGQHSFY